MRKPLLLTILAIAPGCTRDAAKSEPTRSVSVSSAAAPTLAVEDPKLLQLRDEMFGMKREDAFAKAAHFRPMCDKDGYPLVGNLSTKSPDQGPQPSEMCAEIRKKK